MKRAGFSHWCGNSHYRTKPQPSGTSTTLYQTSTWLQRNKVKDTGKKMYKWKSALPIYCSVKFQPRRLLSETCHNTRHPDNKILFQEFQNSFLYIDFITWKLLYMDYSVCSLLMYCMKLSSFVQHQDSNNFRNDIQQQPMQQIVQQNSKIKICNKIIQYSSSMTHTYNIFITSRPTPFELWVNSISIK